MAIAMNRDINSRFEDWLISPTETLDFEVKGWLDLNDAEARGTVAKAMIALENHGGGFLLIGFSEDQERLIPDPQRPTSLAQYGTDEINAIIKKYAEPSFHAHVTFQKHRKPVKNSRSFRWRGQPRYPFGRAALLLMER